VPFTVKVLDFGIAKAVADNATAAKVSRTIGSPLWMAPEQAQLGARLTPATDVWPLGLIVFYLLTGKYYWRAPNAGAGDLMMVLNEVMLMPLDPASARAAEYGLATALPAGFDGWFARCVDRDASLRWPSARAAWDELAPLFGDAPMASASAAAHGTQVVSMVPAAPAGVHVATQAWQATERVSAELPVQSSGQRPSWLLPAAGVSVAVLAIGLVAAVAARSTPGGVEAARPETAGGSSAATTEQPQPPAEVVAASAVPGDAQVRPAHTAAVVRALSPTVTGQLSPLSIRRVALRNLNEINQCYAQGLATHPNLAGRVVVRFIIGGTGSVMGSNVADSSIPVPSVGECIANAVRRWQFQAPEGGGVVTVNYPFNLQPGAS